MTALKDSGAFPDKNDPFFQTNVAGKRMADRGILTFLASDTGKSFSSIPLVEIGNYCLKILHCTGSHC
jgi:hypothetical protein